MYMIRLASPLLLLLLTSCAAWEFTDLPTRDEFTKPIPVLFEEHPELATVKHRAGRIFFTPITETPPAMGIKRAWGMPDRWRWSWWNIIQIVPIFHFQTVWFYEIEDKRVKVLVNHPIAYGWAGHVWSVKIEPAESSQ